MGRGRRGSFLRALLFLAFLAWAFSFAAASPAQTPLAASSQTAPGAPQTSPLPATPSSSTQSRPGMPRRDQLQAQRTESGDSVIRGRVVALDSGSPLRRVKLRLSGVNMRQARAVLSDAQGQFEFKDLPAGRYNLMATKGGYVSLQYGQRGPTDTGRPIDLADGQTLPKVDLALPRGAVITGRVVDETGEPIADVPVTALQYLPLNGRRRLIPGPRPPVQTNDIGQYRIHGLPPGEYYLSASSRNGMGFMDAQPDEPSGYAPTFYPGTPNVNEAQRLSLGVGEEVVADVQLTPTKLVRISGSVVEADGKPASNGFLMLQTRGSEALGPMMSAATAMVRPDGTFVLAGVANGSYKLVVTTNIMDSATRETATMPITVSDQDIGDLRLATTKGTTLVGHISFEGGAPDAVTAKQVRAMCTPVEPDNILMGYQPIPPNDQGQVEIKGITAPCLVNAFGGGAAWTLKLVTLNGIDITDHLIEPAEKTITGVEMTFTNRLTTLSGSVADAQSQPVKDYTVVVFPEDSQKWQPPIASRYVRRARPDQTGLFKLTGLPPARYLVVALDNVEQGLETDPEFLTKLPPLATRAELSEGGIQNLSLRISKAPSSR